MTSDPVVAVPADLELEDRLAGPVTFRMAGWLATAAAGVALLTLARDLLWVSAPGVLLLCAGLAGALWRPAGRPAPAWIGPLWSYRGRRRTAGSAAGPSADAEPVPAAPAVPAAALDLDFEPEPLLRTWPACWPSASGVLRRVGVGVRGLVPGLLTGLVLAAAVAVTVSVLGIPPGWPRGSLVPDGPPAAPAMPPGGLTPPAPSGGAVPDPSAPPAPEHHHTSPHDGTAPPVLVPADPFWLWLEGDGWLGTHCDC